MIGSLTFLNPWALVTLLALPALYFLLRITPPAPKIIEFPAARLLADLHPKQNTPSHTPWWILLLRMVIAALLLIALAQPVLNPAQTQVKNGSLVLIIDNGWGAAQNWDDIQETAENEIKQAGRQGKNIFIIGTAPDPIQTPFSPFEPFTQSDAFSYVRALQSYPWHSDLVSIRDKLPDIEGHVVWLTDGLEKPKQSSFVKALQSYSAVNIYTPAQNNLPFALKKSDNFQAKPSITLNAPDGTNTPAYIQLLDERGQILDEMSLETVGKSFPLKVEFDLPPAIQNRAASFRIAGQKSAAARYFLDNIGGPKTVGIVASEEAAQTRQLTEDSFYLIKALEPYATILQGTLDDMIAQAPSMIILPDIGTMPPDTLNALSTWVNDGGLLLRFAGPNMAQAAAQDILTPVPLRSETRNVKGSLSWDKPLKVQPIAPESPLYGLNSSEDIEVSGQILPTLPDDPDHKFWAQLEDGTPLITAAEQENGLIIMVHTTASPEWSNMPLSGFYVQFLKRTLKFAGQSNSALNTQNGLLQPVKVMDGFGVLQSPESQVQPINTSDFENTKPGPEHPPGFYGRGGLQRALNLGDHVGAMQAINDIDGASIQPYGQVFETNLVPTFITSAFVLFIIDALIMFLLSSAFFTRLQKQSFAAALLLALLFLPTTTHAQSEPAAQDLYLAYIQTGNPAIDATSKKGLEVLAAALNIRTSAEPKGVKGVDPEKDTLVFYPLLYWPISNAQTAPSSQALQNLQAYLDHGGTILVDTRDGRSDNQNLRRILGGLNIPPLAEIPEDHVLGKSFYLMKTFPGRYESGELWVESTSAGGRDGVSSVILGSHDWAGAWAELNVLQRGPRQYIQGASRRHEMSLRFGINLVMYALTGNYKADQVHVPHILERLGRDRRNAR